MHNEIMNDPESRARFNECMEELIREKKILSELRDFIMIGTDNGTACLNVDLIASVYQDDRATRCMVTVNSDEAFWSTETLIEVVKKINKARSTYQAPPMQAIKSILENIKDLDPDFSKTVDEHFDELIDKAK